MKPFALSFLVMTLACGALAVAPSAACIHCAIDAWVNHGCPNDFMATPELDPTIRAVVASKSGGEADGAVGVVVQGQYLEARSVAAMPVQSCEALGSLEYRDVPLAGADQSLLLALTEGGTGDIVVPLLTDYTTNATGPVIIRRDGAGRMVDARVLSLSVLPLVDE